MTKNKELSAEQALELAKNEADAGNKKKAEKYYNAVLNKYPENKQAIDGIRALHPNTLFRSDLDELEEALQANKFKEVEVRAKMLLELYPEVYELFHILGVALSAQNKNLESLQMFKRAAELCPHSDNIQFNLGNAYFTQREFIKALKCYKKTIDISPDYGMAHFQAGNAFFELKDYKNSIEAFEIAIKFFPKSINVISNFSDCHYDAGNYKEALSLLKGAVALTEKPAKLINKMGDINLHIGQFDNAIEVYQRASEQEPDRIEYHLKIADVEKIRGDYSAAKKRFEKILNVYKDHPICLTNLSVICHLLDEDQLSKSYLDKLDDKKIAALANPGQDQFCMSYKKFMTKLHEFNKLSRGDNTNISDKIYAFGGDTAISLKGHQISIDGEKYIYDAKWLANDRAVMIARTDNNLFKVSLNHQISKLEKGANILFAFGSNDFLPTTAFLKDAKNNKNVIAKSVKGLVTGYFNNSLLMAKDHNLNLTFVAVPAPVVDIMVEGAREVSELIQLFNAELQALCEAEKLTFIDLFSFTDGGNGCADQNMYIEGIHILPTAINDALAQ